MFWTQWRQGQQQNRSKTRSRQPRTRLMIVQKLVWKREHLDTSTERLSIQLRGKRVLTRLQHFRSDAVREDIRLD